MPSRKEPSNTYTIFFVFVLCLVAALILSVMATVTRAPQLRAQQLDLAKQILGAARVYHPDGYFQMLQDGKYIPAKWDAQKGQLVPGSPKDLATSAQVYQIFSARVLPRLTDARGNVKTFAEAGIDYQDYLDQHSKEGYARLSEKLFYDFLPNYPVHEVSAEEVEPMGYILPLSGFGLWGPVYGFVALERNADTVVGATWQGPAETPGLGAEIQNPTWQAQFDGKKIFRPGLDGSTNVHTAALGMIVVKGKVKDVFGQTPRSSTAVDGISGATITGDGVTAAFKDSLAPYRPLLVKLHEEAESGGNGN